MHDVNYSVFKFKINVKRRTILMLLYGLLFAFVTFSIVVPLSRVALAVRHHEGWFLQFF
jgi:hypothetical protein